MERKAAAVLFSFSSLLFFVALFHPFVLNAEIVQLKNGNAIETKILRETDEFVVVQAPGGKVKIPKSDIKTIWRGSSAELLTVHGKQVFFSKGLELYQEGRFQDAAENFQKALGPQAINAILYANIGSAYASAGDFQNAKENYLRALDRKPNDPDILMNLGHLYESIRDYRTGAYYYKKVMALAPDALDLKRHLAYCLYMSGDHLGAARLFEEMGQKNDVVAICNAAAAYMQAGEMDRATAILSQLLESPSPIPRAYLLMGELSRLRKDFAGAEDYYTKALRTDSDTAKVKAGLGWLYMDMKEWSKAETAFYEAQAKDPASLGAARGLAQLFIQKEEFQKAVAQYEQLASKDPNNLGIVNSLGLVYLKMNNPKAALQNFQRILAQNDQDAKAHTNAGLAYALMDDADNALKEWNRALQLDPQLEPALQNKKLLEDAMQGSKSEQTIP